MRPAVSQQNLYLVGYSQKLSKYNVGCVRTRYLYKNGDWVKRSLTYVFTFETEPWQTQSAAIDVQWKPYAALLHVKASDYVQRNLGAKPTYVIRTYGDNFLLLSDLNEVPSTCSLWVTIDNVEIIPETINRTFYTICPDPVYVPFNQKCFS
ncbi:uncharacterized protein LOC119400727 [Rhipicephalus sanguineus]|uniref:uncharacterized protein LOC119400727 n=1 Tax=Rhipicephalus sanguineus TaxID=34632 RepID=UPI0020C41E22|nr:uncharacterized protein LOC119400727 [Rhipicephalus sanguineus]